MNKSLIYSYICDLEIELLGVLAYNQFAGLIVSEIVNEAIIVLHELKGGFDSDERTAKDLIRCNIKKFYAPANLVKVEDKLRNWDNRVCYGHRGRIMLTTRDLVELRIATDTTIKYVAKEKDTMLQAVRDFSFKSKSTNKSKIDHRFIVVFVGIILFALASIGIYSYSISNRYQRINAEAVFDNWTGKSIYIRRRKLNINHEETDHYINSFAICVYPGFKCRTKV